MPHGGTIRSGNLRHRVIVQVATETAATASGEVTDAWATEATVYARVEPVSSRESVEMQQVAPDITHTVTMRHRTMNTERRLLHKKDATTLNGAIDNSVTTVVVAADLGISTSTEYRIQVDSEIMIVTAGVGTTSWTVTRGADGTSAASHLDAAAVTHMAILNIQSIINIDEADKQIILGCTEKP